MHCFNSAFNNTSVHWGKQVARLMLPGWCFTVLVKSYNHSQDPHSHQIIPRLALLGAIRHVGALGHRRWNVASRLEGRGRVAGLPGVLLRRPQRLQERHAGVVLRHPRGDQDALHTTASTCLIAQ